MYRYAPAIFDELQTWLMLPSPGCKKPVGISNPRTALRAVGSGIKPLIYIDIILDTIEHSNAGFLIIYLLTFI